MSQPWCLASRDDGSLCREPATIFDPERGGMVCWRHDPGRDDRFCGTEADAEDMTWTAPAEEKASCPNSP